VDTQFGARIDEFRVAVAVMVLVVGKFLHAALKPLDYVVYFPEQVDGGGPIFSPNQIYCC
jgi:hypothetical protein